MQATKRESTRTWIGLAEVRPVPGNDGIGDVGGAWVLLAGLAPTESDYRIGAGIFCDEMGFVMLGLEEVAPLDDYDDYVGRLELDPGLLERARFLTVDARYTFGTFHTYPLEGA